MQVITLHPGDTYVLPKGKKVKAIYADPDLMVDSKCDLPDPEDLVCYTLFMGMPNDNGSGRTLMADNLVVFGFTLDGVFTQISDWPVAVNNDMAQQFTNVVNTQPWGPLIKDVCFNGRHDSMRGDAMIWAFKCPEWLGKSLTVEARGEGLASGPATGILKETFRLFPASEQSAYADGNYRCGCAVDNGS